MLERRKSGGVLVRIFRDGNNQVIAAFFALDANHPRNPPSRRVIEQQAFRETLEQVHEIVVAFDMHQFVKQDRFDLSGWKAGEHPDRHQDYRTKMTEKKWHVGQT